MIWTQISVEHTVTLKTNILTKLRNLWDKDDWNWLWYKHNSNSFQTSWDTSPIKIEAVVDKLCKYFYISRITDLQNVYDDSRIRHQKVLQHGNIQFLPLPLLISHTLDMFESLKNYFINEPKLPTIILNVLVSNSCKFWLLVWKIYNQNIKQMEQKIFQLFKLSVNYNDWNTIQIGKHWH